MATPRQKKRKGDKGKTSAPPRRGDSQTREQISKEESACNARKTAAGKNCQRVRGGFSDMPAASLWHIKDRRDPVAWTLNVQEPAYR